MEAGPSTNIGINMKAQNKTTKEIFHVFSILRGEHMILVDNGIHVVVETKDYTLLHCPAKSKAC